MKILNLFFFLICTHSAFAQFIADPQQNLEYALLGAGIQQINITPSGSHLSISNSLTDDKSHIDNYNQWYEYNHKVAGTYTMTDGKIDRITAVRIKDDTTEYVTVSFENGQLKSFTDCPVNNPNSPSSPSASNGGDDKTICTSVNQSICDQLASKGMSTAELNAAFDACNVFDKKFGDYTNILKGQDAQVKNDVDQIKNATLGKSTIGQPGSGMKISEWVQKQAPTFKSFQTVTPVNVSNQSHLNMLDNMRKMTAACDSLINRKYLTGNTSSTGKSGTPGGAFHPGYRANGSPQVNP